MKIAQYCSGLEALVSTSSSELTHQVAERAACLLEPPGTARIERFKKIKKGYEFRSRAVHGASFKAKDFDEIRAMSCYIDDICRNLAALYLEDVDGLRAIIDGSADELNNFLLNKVLHQ